MIPGEVITKDHEITLNENRKTATIKVLNIGDRPVQVGSHYHFYEVNKALEFDRAIAFGKHLNIASGTSVRFEPGETKTIELVEVGGKKEIYGLAGLTNGAVNDETLKEKAGLLKEFLGQ